MRVEIWSDVVCPWCYLGKRRFEKALAQFPHRDEVTVVHRSFQLDPDAPADQTVETAALLSAKYGMPAERVDQMQREMERLAAEEGLDYHLDGQRSGNTVDAHRLLRLAAHRGRQDALIERLYRAYFSEQRSVFDSASLRAIAVGAGLAGEDIDTVLAGEAYADEVSADIDRARELGITGVPFFVIDQRYAIAGAQPVEAFGQALEQAHAYES